MDSTRMPHALMRQGRSTVLPLPTGWLAMSLFVFVPLVAGLLPVTANEPQSPARHNSGEQPRRIQLLIESVESNQDDPELVLEQTAELLALLQQNPDPIIEARARIERGFALQAKCKKPEALEQTQLAAELAEQHSRSDLLGEACYVKAVVEWKLGELESAAKTARRARKIQMKAGPSEELAKTFTLLGVIHRSLSNYERAVDLHLKSLQMASELQLEYAVARSHNNLGLIYWNLGRHEDAKQSFVKAVNYYAEVDDKNKLRVCQSNLGLILIELGQPEDALEHLEDALANSPQDEDDFSLAKLLSNLGFAYSELGDQELALEFNQRSLGMRKRIGDQKGIVRSSGSIAALYLKNNDLQEALRVAEKALELAREIGARAEQADLLELVAECLHELGDHQRAYENLREYHELSAELRGAEVQERISRLEERFKAEKQKREILALESDAAARQAQIEKQQNRQIYLTAFSLILGLCLVLLFGLLFSRIRALKAQQNLNSRLTAAATRLSESERRYRTLFENADLPTMLITLDSQQAIDLNVPAKELCGVEQIELGIPLAELRPDWVRDGLLRSLQTTEQQPSFEDCWIEDNGFLRWAEFSGTVVRVDDGQALLVSVRDTTSLRAQEKARLRADKLQSLGSLAGGIAHDFNNALAAILGYVSLAAKRVSGEAAEELKMAEQATVQAARLTSQLLTFSNGGEPVRRVQSVPPLIHEAIDLCGAGSHMAISSELDDELWCAALDAGQFVQVVSNLVINAQQATESGGHLRISATNFNGSPPVGALEDGKYLKIEFEDDGHGIPDDIQDRVFDPYFTTKKEGSGLGLATTFAVVRRHGGAIEMKSRDGEGTMFSVFLPATAASTPTDINAASSGDMLGHGSLLVLEDEPNLQEIYRLLLEGWGYTVEFTSNGKATVEKYLAQFHRGLPFDLLIMDLTIPGGMGGREALTHILEHDPKARAVVVSGYSNDPTMANHEEAGFAAALAKPFRPAELAAVIKDVLSAQLMPASGSLEP